MMELFLSAAEESACVTSYLLKVANRDYWDRPRTTWGLTEAAAYLTGDARKRLFFTSGSL